MTAYQAVLALKFVGIMVLAAGLGAAFICTARQDRKLAVHRVASPGLLMTWLCGYVLLLLSGWPLFELWVVGGFVLSLVAHTILVYSVERDRRGLSPLMMSSLPLVLVVGLMVLRPTWTALIP